jgi:hypothetical protein
MFHFFTLSSIPLYLSVPFFVEQAVSQSDVIPMYAFIGATVGTISIMGGTYAILPAYEADLFGPKNVGPTHGVMMMYSAAAALFGKVHILKLTFFEMIAPHLLPHICRTSIANPSSSNGGVVRY